MNKSDAVAKALPDKRKKHRRVIWISVTAGVLAVAILLAVLFPFPCMFGKSSDSSTRSRTTKKRTEETEIMHEGYRMAQPEYPEMPLNPSLSEFEDSDERMEKRDEWEAVVQSLRAQPSGYKDGYMEYYKDVLPVLFADAGKENRVVSPLSLYMALGMTAEITDGNTRQQILDVMHQPDIGTLREHAHSIWLANYMDDGLSKLLLANSIWLNSSKKYNQDVLDTLAEQYFAASFSGDPSEAEYSEELQNWVNAQTDDLLSDKTGNLTLDPNLVMALVSTVNYSGKWVSKFVSRENRVSAFHTEAGDVDCEFMYTSSLYDYYEGEGFSATQIRTQNNGAVRLILPDEGITTEELLDDPELLEFMCCERFPTQDSEEGRAHVRLTVPKFDVSSELDLIPALKNLGITDAIDPSASDFSPLTSEGEGVHITSARQDTRVMIDEEGVKAVSVTIMLSGAGQPDRYVDMTMDRPFIFEIVSDTGLPLFVGVIQNPS